MKQKGWIKLYREILDNPTVMKDGDHLAVWVWLLMNATSKRKPVRFGGEQIYLNPGELTTGRRKIAKALNISEYKVQRILSMFEESNQISQQTDRQCRLISIINWDKFQVHNGFNENTQKNKKTAQQTHNGLHNGLQGDSPYISSLNGDDGHYSAQRNAQDLHNDPPTNRQRPDTKQEREKGRIEREYTRTPSFEEVKDYVQQMNYEMDPEAFFDYYEETGWMKKNGQLIKDWKASVRTWARREREFKRSGKYGNGSKPVEPPKYKVFGPEEKIDAVAMPDNVRAAVNKILK